MDSQAPKSIADLSTLGRSFVFSDSIDFRKWIHVAKTVLREADVYKDEHDHARAFVMYQRFSHLVLNSMPTHPGYARYKVQFKQLTALIPSVIKTMEQLHEIINQEIESYRVMQLARQKRIERASLAQAEAQRRASLGSESYASTTTTSLEPHRRTSQTRGDDDDNGTFMDTLSSLKKLKAPSQDLINAGTATGASSTSWSYPSVPQTLKYNHYDSPHNTDEFTPRLPPKHDLSPLDSSTTLISQSPPPSLQTSSASIEHKTRHTLEDGSPLRTVFVPERLRAEFLRIAKPNTANNLETCGILCGKLNRNALFITALVIPPQESTSDTCQTTDEEVLFEYVDKHDLIILGWIHTHPTQSCFLSSIDLHTQTSYQIMLPEAIAIVCAPQHAPSWGVFRLTDPPGIPIMKKCRAPAAFHPHPEPDLYKTAHQPGHVEIRELSYVVDDLRKK